MDNVVVAGALYLANGGGNLIAGRLAGREWAFESLRLVLTFASVLRPRCQAVH